MKLNDMKPANRSTVARIPPTLSDSVANSSPAAQPMKPNTCRRMRPTRSASSTANTIPTDARTNHGRKNGGCEYSNAVGTEVLQEPWNGGKDGPVERPALEQFGPTPFCWSGAGQLRKPQNDVPRIARLARQELLDFHLGIGDPTAENQPGRPLHHEEAA